MFSGSESQATLWSQLAGGFPWTKKDDFFSDDTGINGSISPCDFTDILNTAISVAVAQHSEANVGAFLFTPKGPFGVVLIA
jgi:hypothetical protein